MLGRLDVRCIGSSNSFGHSVNGEATGCFALLYNNAPFLLVGCGGGVVKSCFRQLGCLPSAVFLPSIRLSSFQDLQAYIQHEAAYQRKVKVFAAADVLDKAISVLDEEIVQEVKEFVEFLQVEPNVPTSVHSHYYFIMTGVNKNAIQAPRGAPGAALHSGISTCYNMILLDIHQQPLLAYLEGPTYKDNLADEANVFFRQCPSAIANIWKYFSQPQFEACVGSSTRLHITGFANDNPPPLQPPAVALHCGEAFVVPTSLDSNTQHPPPEYIAPAANTTPRRRPQQAEAEAVLSPNDPGWLRQTAKAVPPSHLAAPKPSVNFEANDHHHHHQPPPTQQYPSAASSRPYEPPQQEWSQQYPATSSSRPSRGGAVVAGESSRSNSVPDVRLATSGFQPSARQGVRTRSPGASRPKKVTPTPRQGHFSQVDNNYGRSPSGGFTTYGGKPRSYQAKGNIFHHVAEAPRKLFVFNNENKQDEPSIVMLAPGTNLSALRKKVSTSLKLLPMGQLYTVDGGQVQHTDELFHGQEVVATKHGGAPFDLAKLPFNMTFSRPAAMAAEEGEEGYDGHGGGEGGYYDEEEYAPY